MAVFANRAEGNEAVAVTERTEIRIDVDAVNLVSDCCQASPRGQIDHNILAVGRNLASKRQWQFVDELNRLHIILTETDRTL